MWFLILTFIHFVAGASDTTKGCDRYQARLARNILQDKILSVASARGYEIPPECPFHPQWDHLKQDEEKGKERVRGTQWKCSYCNKVFAKEHWLDRHFGKRHPSNVSSGSICLADYCHLLDCKEREREEDDSLLDEVSQLPSKPCQPQEKARERHLCQALMPKCFPPGKSSLAHTLHDEFTAKICDALTCDVKKKDIRGGFRSRLYYVLVALVLMLLVMYYIAVFLWRSETAVGKDLKRMRQIRPTTNTWFRQRKRRLE